MVKGEKSNHVAFVRGGQVVSIIPRFTATLANGWKGTTFELPQGDWKNALLKTSAMSGSCLVADTLKHFPVALLVSGA